jgi:hypothetical protein
MATFLLKLKQKLLAIFSIEYQWIAYRTENCVNDYKNQSHGSVSSSNGRLVS